MMSDPRDTPSRTERRRGRRDITKEWRPVSVRLPPALHDAAIHKAFRSGCTVTEVIRSALRRDLGLSV